MSAGKKMTLSSVGKLTVLVLLLVALAGCKKPETAQVESSAESVEVGDVEGGENAEASSANQLSLRGQKEVAGEPLCPMAVPGTTAEAVKLDEVAGIEFSTAEGDVALLRKLVGEKVRVHQREQVAPDKVREPSEKMLERMNEQQRERYMSRFEHRRLINTATVNGEEIEGGMRVQLKPADPDELDKLFAAVEETTERLVKMGARCPEEERRRVREARQQRRGALKGQRSGDEERHGDQRRLRSLDLKERKDRMRVPGKKLGPGMPVKSSDSAEPGEK